MSYKLYSIFGIELYLISVLHYDAILLMLSRISKVTLAVVSQKNVIDVFFNE